MHSNVKKDEVFRLHRLCFETFEPKTETFQIECSSAFANVLRQMQNEFKKLLKPEWNIYNNT
jgi:hypothetical protein